MRSGEVIHFDIKTPLNDGILLNHIAHARTLGLPDAVPQADKTLTVIAGGPSAWLAPQDGPTLALNGALRVCKRPTYYAACDPQKEVAQFLTEAPDETVYYMASKCHPDVFDSLKGKDVRLWDVGDLVPGGIPTAVSITLTALNLFIRLGWRKFNVYGWDGCYKDGRDHAVPQHHVGDNITLLAGDRSFETTTTWAAEAEDAMYLLPLYEFMGIEVNIHGDSMIQAIREFKAA